MTFLAAALAALGRIKEASEVAAAMMQLEPRFRLSVYERTRQPFRAPEIKDGFFEAPERGRFSRVIAIRSA
jgi:hypothetical protein